MRAPVLCKNCGLKWVRVTAFGSDTELYEDLQYNCPKCGSTWFQFIDEESTKEGTQTK